MWIDRNVGADEVERKVLVQERFRDKELGPILTRSKGHW